MCKKIKFLLVFLIIYISNIFSQTMIKGTVYDKKSKETLIGANIIISDIGKGTMTDIDGFFQIEVEKIPIEIEVSFIGYEKKIVLVETSSALKIYLGENKELLSEIVIIDSRLTEKQKQSPITVEAMDVIAIKETPAASFYEGLGALKGVDVTSASMGFKIINTRGFNSTSPVRSLQIIDGIDNQSPGLNFSLGNFLGASELDLKKVEIIVGANSSLYGPNAFNGVISMETKNPFQFPGFSAQLKGGSRDLHEISFRWAQNFKNKNGENKFGYKLNYYKMTANDWVANNYNQAFNSPSTTNNLGGYDAVNVYGDEEYSSYNNFSLAPGLGTFHRPGYREEDLVDYDTENIKMNAAIFFKPTAKTELIYSTNYGNGTTVYQGDNRYSLKDLQFFQNRIEFRQKDKFFIRFYETHEDAGNSYDAVATAITLQNMQMSKKKFSEEYTGYWTNSIIPQILEIPGWINVLDIQFFETDPETGETLFDEEGIPIGIPNAYQNWSEEMNEILDNNLNIFQSFHLETQEYMDTYVGQFGNSFLVPGTPEFQEAFNEITSQTRYDEQGNLTGGTMFYDKSRLYHGHAEYKFDLGLNKFVIGANARMYAPNSNGSIFDDGYIQSYQNIYEFDENGDYIFIVDTTFVDISTNPLLPEIIEVIDTTYQFTIDTIVKDIKIQNKEFGIYMGYNRDFLSETLKLAGSIRMDKNENYNYLFSPAASIVYTPSEKDVLRVSLSSAIRNPTLTDQFLNYDAGTGILLGNLNGYGFNEYFANIDSLSRYLDGDFINNVFKYDYKALANGLLQINPIRPEKVKTIEIGYRTTLFDKLYIDASSYFSIYRDFIGYQTGASFRFASSIDSASTIDVLNGWANEVGDSIDDYTQILFPSIQPYRLAANASETVTTKGFTIGLNYFLSQNITFNANYSYNKLNKKGSNDPIIPAYNTPEHKFNIGVSGREINLFNSLQNWGFSVNYKWVEGFLFEGSPQFTGLVPTYGQLDAQINKSIPSIYSTLKLGASNLLDNFTYQVYGGPRVGRMLYLSLQIDIE